MEIEKKYEVIDCALRAIDKIRASRQVNWGVGLYGGGELSSSVRHRCAEAECRLHDWLANGGPPGVAALGEALRALDSAAKGAEWNPRWDGQHGFCDTARRVIASASSYESRRSAPEASFASPELAKKLREEGRSAVIAAEQEAVRAIIRLCQVITTPTPE